MVGLILGLSVIKLVEILFVFTTKAKRQISRQTEKATERIKRALGMHREQFVSQVGAQFPTLVKLSEYAVDNSKMDFVPENPLHIVKKRKKQRKERKSTAVGTDKN